LEENMRAKILLVLMILGLVACGGESSEDNMQGPADVMSGDSSGDEVVPDGVSDDDVGSGEVESQQDYCETFEDCDDNDPDTFDYCNPDHTCGHGPQVCVSSRPCVEARYDEGLHHCIFEHTGCACSFQEDECDDNDPGTADFCGTSGDVDSDHPQYCFHLKLCEDDGECQDSDSCTIDFCRSGGNLVDGGVCRHTPKGQGDLCYDSWFDYIGQCSQEGVCVFVEDHCQDDGECPKHSNPCLVARCTTMPEFGNLGCQYQYAGEGAECVSPFTDKAGSCVSGDCIPD
jgi:hypothetical protein